MLWGEARYRSFGFGLTLLRYAHLQRGAGNLHIVDRLEAVEEIDAGAEAVTVVEGGRVDVGIGLRVHGAAEVVVGVDAAAYLRGEGGKHGLAARDACIPGLSLANAHLCRVADRILHTVLHAHHALLRRR